MISAINKWLHKHQLLTLLGFFFIIQLLFLTKLPVFNDEAIYLDWAWRETHVPGFLFYSLYDAKQPLLMWLFGIGESVLSDPLFAGRMIAVTASILSGWGIFKLSSLYLDKKYSLLSVFLFFLIPLNFFYNRQALMESSMICVGIWMGYYTLRLLQSSAYTEAIILGLITGLGYFIKSTTLVFLIASVIVLLITRLQQNRLGLFVVQISTLFGTILCCDILLFIQPYFWATLGSNNRYVFSLLEAITQPPALWATKMGALASILFWGVTPIVLFLGAIGVFQFYMSQKMNMKRQLVGYFVIAFMLQFIFARSISTRYVVPFLGIFCFFALYELSLIRGRVSKLLYTILVLILFMLPISISTLQLVSPQTFLSEIPLEDNKMYLYGQTSGYGIIEAVSFLKHQIGDKKATIGVGLQTGNPEDSVIMYFQKNSKVHTAYFDTKGLGDLSSYGCLTANNPIYFVSRNEELVGLDRFLDKQKTISQPRGNYSIGIYTLRSDCNGKTLHLGEQNTYED